MNNLGLKLTSLSIVLAVGVVILVAMDGFVSVGAGEVGVVFDRGRGVLQTTIPEGLHLKIPFWQSVDKYNIKTQEYTMSQLSSEGAMTGDDSIHARSRDGQTVNMEATVLFHLETKDAPYVKQNLGSEQDYSRIVVRPKSRSIIREVVARYDALDLVSEKRNDIVKEMSETVKESFAKNRITLDEVVLRDVTFSPEFSNAIEQKQIAFQKIKTAEYRKEESEQVKQQKIIEAEGESRAIELKGAALKNNPSIVQLEFVNKMAGDIKWGILPDTALPLLDLKSLQ